MPRPKPITPEQARRSPVARLARVADKVRQVATRLGARPYRCFLVWTRFSGEVRGEGDEIDIKRVELLPTPKVESLDAISLNAVSAGIVPVGAIKLTKVSADRYTFDMLNGRYIPQQHEDELPEPYDFYYELHEDGRLDPDPTRQRYRLLTPPTLKGAGTEWVFSLERASEERNRQGQSRFNATRRGQSVP